MATFPTINAANVGQTPSSLGSNYTLLVSFPFPTAQDADKALFYSSQGPLTYDKVLTEQQADDYINPAVSAGILKGMEITINGNAIDISAGEYVTKDQTIQGAEDYVVTQFTGATSLPVQNPQNTWFVSVNIDRLGNISFDPAPARRTKVYIGALEVKGTTTPVQVYNDGDRLLNLSGQFTYYINNIGLFQEGIVVGLKTNGTITTTGGTVYSGSTYKGLIIPPSTGINFQLIDDTGLLSAVKTTTTITELKTFKPVGGADQSLSGSGNHVAWFVFIGGLGNFLLLKPQEVFNPAGTNDITDAEVYNVYSRAVLPPRIANNATLVGAFVVSSADTTLTGVQKIDMINKPISNNIGSSIANADAYITYPSAVLTKDQQRMLPKTGDAYLAAAGSSYRMGAALRKDLTGLPDGLLYRTPPSYTNFQGEPLGVSSRPLQWTGTGTLIKPKVASIIWTQGVGSNNQDNKVDTAGSKAFWFGPAGEVFAENVESTIYVDLSSNTFITYQLKDKAKVKQFLTTYGMDASEIDNATGDYATARKMFPFFGVANSDFGGAVGTNQPLETQRGDVYSSVATYYKNPAAFAVGSSTLTGSGPTDLKGELAAFYCATGCWRFTILPWTSGNGNVGTPAYRKVSQNRGITSAFPNGVPCGSLLPTYTAPTTAVLNDYLDSADKHFIGWEGRSGAVTTPTGTPKKALFGIFFIQYKA